MNLFNASAALVVLLLVVRLAQVLSNNPVGEVIEEVVYLRIRDLALAGSMFMIVVLLEVAEFLPPLLALAGLAETASFGGVTVYINGIQAVLLLIGTVVAFSILSGYSRRRSEERTRTVLVDTAAKRKRPRRRLE